jgi:hypothetical protein
MRGIINENIVDALNLRPLDEIMKEQGVDPYPEHQEQPDPEAEAKLDEQIAEAKGKMRKLKQRMDGSDHDDAMDTLHDEVLQHARDLMTYGFNLDSPRARGIFEIAASMYGHALTAKNNKRDAQLKALKLALDNRRVDLEEKRTNHIIGQLDGQTAMISDDGVVVADRNELLKRIRDQD